MICLKIEKAIDLNSRIYFFVVPNLAGVKSHSSYAITLYKFDLICFTLEADHPVFNISYETNSNE